MSKLSNGGVSLSLSSRAVVDQHRRPQFKRCLVFLSIHLLLIVSGAAAAAATTTT